MATVVDEVTVDTLQEFADAFNAHDADKLMTYMTEDCVFEISYGPDACGQRFEGQDAVKVAFASVWGRYPDAQWRRPKHFVAGNRGVSAWTFTGTDRDGTSVEVNGCDIFTFRDGKILVKDSYRKIRTP
jgi:ketosteroid isomerase-like protein